MLDNSASAALIVSQSGSSSAAAGAAMMSLRGQKPMTEAQMDKVAHDFESMFIAQMLGQMFSGTLDGSLFGDASSREVYKSLMMDQYGKEIANAGGIGIADYVKRTLLAIQEVA